MQSFERTISNTRYELDDFIEILYRFMEITSTASIGNNLSTSKYLFLFICLFIKQAFICFASIYWNINYYLIKNFQPNTKQTYAHQVANKDQQIHNINTPKQQVHTIPSWSMTAGL